jgi:site-specific DNA recombinase
MREMMPTGRVFGYARVSSESQAENTSLSVQQERIESWAASRGWASPQVITDVASGANLDRGGLTRLRGTLASGDLVIVYKLDRLSRSVVDLEPLLIEWECAGVSIHSVTEPIETGTAMGRALLRMLVVFAQAEREVIVERVVAGKAKNAESGGYNGGPVPFGYRRTENPHQPFEVDSTSAHVVKALFQQYATGELGMGRLRSATRCPLSEGGIEGVLSNPTYTGRLVWNSVARPAEHEAIIPDRLFLRVQRVRRRRSRGRFRMWKRRGATQEMELRCEQR